MPRKEYEVPGPIAIALTTGRPEMARLGMESMLAQPTVENLTDVRKQLIEFAAGIVQDITNERQNVRVMIESMHNAISNVAGALNAMNRIDEALRKMNEGTSPEEIAEILKSNSQREREKNLRIRTMYESEVET